MKIGLDYGTSTTLVSLIRDDLPNAKPSLFPLGPNRGGYKQWSIPSLIAIDRKGALSYGYDAEQVSNGRSETILLRSLKRCLACTPENINGNHGCLNQANKRYCDGNRRFDLFGHENRVTIEHLIGGFVDHILELLPSDPSKLSVSVPAIYGAEPRRTVLEVILNHTKFARNAGRDLRLDLVNEPTAAILAHSSNSNSDPDGIYAVCDVGGGTTDIVIFEKKGQQLFLFNPGGLPIGGDDVDLTLLTALQERDHGRVRKIDQSMALAEVRRAKEALTALSSVTIFGHGLSREEFDAIIDAPVLKPILNCVGGEIKKVFDLYKPFHETQKPFYMQKVYLSGGGSKIPRLKQVLENGLSHFQPKVDMITDSIFREDFPIVAVALGASTKSDLLQDTVQYMLPYSIQIQIDGKRAEIKLDGKKAPMVPMYSQLPLKFEFSRSRGSNIQILAVDTNDHDRVVSDLTDELVSTKDTGEVLLWDLISDRSYFEIKIDKYNIMRVSAFSAAGERGRPFNLPWQGGIEAPGFEKFRRQWRRAHGYD